jgi:hypothetical protein
VYSNLEVAPEKSPFSFPKDFAGASSRLFRNQHDGTFVDVTGSSGLTENPGRTRHALAADFTHDGRPGLLLLRDDKPPALYRNLGGLKFEEITWNAGAEDWKYAYLEAAVADFNEDGKPDLALWSTIGNEVLINRGGGKFDSEKSLPMVFAPNRSFGFHGVVADVFAPESHDLLEMGNHGQLHLIANRKGHFSMSGVKLENRAGGAATESEVLNNLSAMIATRQKKDAPLLVIGVKMDGQLIAFESSVETKANLKAGSGKIQ